MKRARERERERERERDKERERHLQPINSLLQSIIRNRDPSISSNPEPREGGTSPKPDSKEW